MVGVLEMNNYILSISSICFLIIISSCYEKEVQALDGTWKIVKAESEFVMKSDFLYTGINEFALQPYESDHWTFYDDSIMQSNYPFYSSRFAKYKIVKEEDILNADWYDDFIFSKRLSGDTLILKRRSPKYFETFYLIKQNIIKEQISLLKTDKVDWSFYLQKWKYGMFLESSGMKCPRNFPEILDLSSSNSVSYSFEKNILNYWEDDSLHRFEFSTAFEEELNLKHVCDSGCYGMWLEYNKYE